MGSADRARRDHLAGGARLELPEKALGGGARVGVRERTCARDRRARVCAREGNPGAAAEAPLLQKALPGPRLVLLGHPALLPHPDFPGWPIAQAPRQQMGRGARERRAPWRLPGPRGPAQVKVSAAVPTWARAGEEEAAEQERGVALSFRCGGCGESRFVT